MVLVKSLFLSETQYKTSTVNQLCDVSKHYISNTFYNQNECVKFHTCNLSGLRLSGYKMTYPNSAWYKHNMIVLGGHEHSTYTLDLMSDFGCRTCECFEICNGFLFLFSPHPILQDVVKLYRVQEFH